MRRLVFLGRVFYLVEVGVFEGGLAGFEGVDVFVLADGDGAFVEEEHGVADVLVVD